MADLRARALGRRADRDTWHGARPGRDRLRGAGRPRPGPPGRLGRLWGGLYRGRRVADPPVLRLYRRHATSGPGWTCPPPYRPMPAPPAAGRDRALPGRAQPATPTRVGAAAGRALPLGAAQDPATWRDLLWMLTAPPVGLLGLVAGRPGRRRASSAWSGSPSRGRRGRCRSGCRRRLDHAVVHVVRRGYAGAGAGRRARLAEPADRPGARRGRAAAGRPAAAPAGGVRPASARARRPSTVLAQRVRQLTETRADAVDAQAAELRRIERDLHDGAQARLVAVGLSLATVERLLDTDPAAARALLAQARESSATALTELRDLVRGIHPPVLAERGLADAVRALALDTPLPVDVTAELAGRLPAPVESAAYFAVVRGAGQRGPARAGHPRARSTLATTTACCASRSPTTAAAAPTPPGAPACAGIRAAAGTFDGVLQRAQPGRRPDRRDDGDTVRVVLAEDLYLLRDGLVRLLEAHGFEIVAAVDSGPTLRAGAARAPPGRVHRGRAAAADLHRRGAAGGAGRPAGDARPAGAGALPARRAALRPGAARRRRRRRSATCSRTGSSTPTSSSTRSAGSPPAAPRWTPR